MQEQMEARQALTSPGFLAPFATVAALYFVFGFITNLNMALVPHLRSIFSLSYGLAMLAESAFFLAYVVFSAPTSKLIGIVGYKRTIVFSLFLQAAGCLLFVPAAWLVSFPMFLAAVFVVGSGTTALQTSLNPYVTILGPEQTAPVRLTLAQSLNSVGGTLAPLLAGALILAGTTAQRTPASDAASVRWPYLVTGTVLFAVGVAVAFLHLPPINPSRPDGAVHRQRTSIWSYRHTVLGALGVFLYVGVETGLASIAVNYFMLQGISSLRTASFLVSIYWLGSLAGRLAGSWILTKVSSGRLVTASGAIAASLIATSMFSSGSVAIWSLVLCGLFNSIMFPNIFALGVAGLGPMTGEGSGWIMTACVGGAVVPYLIGALADRMGIQYSFAIPFLCYGYIAYYGVWGSRQQPAAMA